MKEFCFLTIGQHQLFTFPSKCHSGPVNRSSLFLFLNSLFSVMNKTALLISNYSGKIANINFTFVFSSDFPVIITMNLLCNFICIFSCREKLEHEQDKLHLKFEKKLYPQNRDLTSNSKSNFLIWPTGTLFPDSRSLSSSRVVTKSVSLQNVDCVSRYSASGHVQKFAAWRVFT